MSQRLIQEKCSLTNREQHAMPRKRKLKKHSVNANLHVLELTRAGSSLDLEKAEGRKQKAEDRDQR